MPQCCRALVSAAPGAVWPMVPCSAVAIGSVLWWNARARCTDHHYFCLAHQPTQGESPMDTERITDLPYAGTAIHSRVVLL